MDATPTLLWSTRPYVGDAVLPFAVSPGGIPMPGSNATRSAFAVR
jgi:hypothetical protein